MAELKLQLTSEVKTTSQQLQLIKNLREKFSKIYEGRPMATFKTLGECERMGKQLEDLAITFRQRVFRKNHIVSPGDNCTSTTAYKGEPYAIILLSKI